VQQTVKLLVLQTSVFMIMTILAALCSSK